MLKAKLSLPGLFLAVSVFVDQSLEKGLATKARFELVLSKAKSGKNLELRMENFEYLAFRGNDLTPEIRKVMGPMLANLEALEGTIPTIVVSPQGRMVDITEVDEMIERMTNKMKRMGYPDELLESLKAKLKSPAMVAVLKEKASQLWNVLVESWLDIKLKPGEEKTIIVEKIGLDDTVIKAPKIVRNEGKPDKSEYVRLSTESTLDGDDGKSFLLGKILKVKDLRKDVKNAKALPSKEKLIEAIKSVKFFDKSFIDTDPKTLKSKRVFWETKVEYATADQTKTKLSRHDCSFDWTNSGKRKTEQKEKDAPSMVAMTKKEHEAEYLKHAKAGDKAYANGNAAIAESEWSKAMTHAKYFNPVKVAHMLYNFGILRDSEERLAKAEIAYEQALEIYEKELDPDDTNISDCLNNLAVAENFQGKSEEAEKHIKRSLKIAEKKYGSNDFKISKQLINLGEIYTSQKKYQKAESYL